MTPFSPGTANGPPRSPDANAAASMDNAEKLAAKLQFMEHVLDTLQDLVLVIDADGQLVRWNDRLSEVTGYRPEVLRGMQVRDLVPEDQHAAIRRAFRDTLRDGRTTVTTALQTGTGVTIPYEFTTSLLNTTDRLFCVVGRDITEWQEAQAALHQERNLLDHVMNASVAAIAVTDTARNVIFANERAETILRLASPPTGNLPYAPLNFQLLDANDVPLPLDRTPIRRVVSTGQPLFNATCKAEWPDGERRVLSVNAAPLTDDAGTVVRVVLSVNDITQQHHAREALRRSEAKYYRLFDASNDAIFLHALDGTILDANRQATALFGVSADELIGGSIEQLHPPEALDTARSMLERLDAESGGVRFQIRCQHRDGSTFWGEVSASRFELDGAPLVQGIIRDITAQKEAEEQTRRALARERELNTLKSRFVSTVSHELRTPLSTIQSSSELADLFVRRGDAEQASTHLHRIQTTVTTMTELLEDVLHFQRAQTDGLPFEPKAFDLASLAHEVVTEIAQGLGTDHAFDVRGLDDPVPLEADASLVRLILSNLLSNAVKYSDAGSTVRLSVQRTPQALHLTVADEGIGIPPGQLDSLFDPFVRADNVGTIRGTGLGLSIVKEAVDAHDGTITVDSERTVGTTVVVQLPLSPPAS